MNDAVKTVNDIENIVDVNNGNADDGGSNAEVVDRDTSAAGAFNAASFINAAAHMPPPDRIHPIVARRWLWLSVVTVVGFLIDIGTKHLANTRLEYGLPVNVIGDYLQWLLIYNKGAVFGLSPVDIFPSVNANVFFITFMSLAIGFLLLYYKMLKKNETLMHVGLMLVLPGAFGNLHDRIVHGENGVVDFIRMGFPPDNYWFIYNVADIYVTVGVAIMLVSFWIEARKPETDTSTRVVKLVAEMPPEEMARDEDGAR